MKTRDFENSAISEVFGETRNATGNASEMLVNQCVELQVLFPKSFTHWLTSISLALPLAFFCLSENFLLFVYSFLLLTIGSHGCLWLTMDDRTLKWLATVNHGNSWLSMFERG